MEVSHFCIKVARHIFFVKTKTKNRNPKVPIKTEKLIGINKKLTKLIRLDKRVNRYQKSRPESTNRHIHKRINKNRHFNLLTKFILLTIKYFLIQPFCQSTWRQSCTTARTRPRWSTTPSASSRSSRRSWEHGWQISIWGNSSKTF